MSASYRASAPGSLMLMGEHAVLHGRRALVASVDQRLSVVLEPRDDKRVVITSALGRVEQELEQLAVEEPFAFILAALISWQPRLTSGLTLEVSSPFAADLGLGSSAAVTLATHAVLAAFVGENVSARSLFLRGLETVRSVQGIGSGADLAASAWGGFVLYRADPVEICRLAHIHPLTVVYSGKKEPTPKVVRQVEAARQASMDEYEAYFDRMDRLVMDAADAVEAEDWSTLGERLTLHQEIMKSMKLNTPDLDRIVEQLQQAPGILGAKISGSGLGDCAVGLGRSSDLKTAYRVLDATSGAEGVRLDQA